MREHALEWFKGTSDRAGLTVTGSHICYIRFSWLINSAQLFSRACVGNQMLVIHGGSNQTIADHYRLMQYVYDGSLPALLLLLTRACHHHALLMELTVLPDCLGLDPRGVFVGRTRAGFASPGVKNVLFFSPINNKSLLSRWRSASRRRAACQADR